MAEKTDLLTAGNIAKTLNASPVAVKKAIQSLGIKPALVKGGCSYYSKDAVTKIKSAVK